MAEDPFRLREIVLGGDEPTLASEVDFMLRKRQSTLCMTCGIKEGVPRVDAGLAAGVHCDKCWEKMVTACRQRSW